MSIWSSVQYFMIWIAVAAVLNTVWTLWCIRMLPPKIATRYGAGGNAQGWMSRPGYAAFGILTPVVVTVFQISLGNQSPSDPGLLRVMEIMSIGIFVFFMTLSWCIVRSNRNSPPKLDFLSLMASIAVLGAFLIGSIFGAGPSHKTTSQSDGAPISSHN